MPIVTDLRTRWKQDQDPGLGTVTLDLSATSPWTLLVSNMLHQTLQSTSIPPTEQPSMVFDNIPASGMVDRKESSSCHIDNRKVVRDPTLTILSVNMCILHLFFPAKPCVIWNICERCSIWTQPFLVVGSQCALKDGRDTFDKIGRSIHGTQL